MKRLTAVVAALGAVIMMGSAAYCAEVKDAQYYFKQGNDIEWKNNRLGAIDSYTEALKLNPDYVEARVARGKLYYFTGQYAKALEDFNYFYNKPNYGPTVYYEFRINCKKKLGQYAEAVDDMYEVILAYGGNSRLLQDMMDTVNQHSDLEYKLKPVSHPELLAKYKPNAKKLRDYAKNCADDKSNAKNKEYADFFMEMASAMDPEVTHYSKVIYDTPDNSAPARMSPTQDGAEVMDVDIQVK
ncbi:MAG TPA: tetratricopeptide repeat protein [Candidatus Limenecus avicola]|jgi:hypothetical protein|uniref:Tetratricopeptide repeat protein n=1 Tax=Candidatus Limenecus avicola TaxID=2840847 RepID=A0A9D1N1L2_9CLOT|nr:tetratricopeptide repeat protein [Candidatus Limenecus avicola]